MSIKKLAIASDHAGFALKESLKKRFPTIEWEDLGTHNEESCHYPDYAQSLCKWILDHGDEKTLLEQKGVLICGSGQGMAMTANRFFSVRAALCWNEESAKLSRQHNASNILCLGARLLSEDVAVAVLATWLETKFEGGRHLSRVEQMDTDECEADCDCC